MNRSPMAASFLRRRADELGVDAVVRSAGFLGIGYEAVPDAIDVMSSRGLDISGHRSTMLTTSLVQRSDLILTMTRDHLRRTAVLVPGAFEKTFTFKELVRRCLRIGDRGDEALSSWLHRLNLERDPMALLGENTDDDITDPMGGTTSQFVATADQISLLVDGVAYHLWGWRPAQGSTAHS
jgi:protein-tyrosine-phosphatase